MSLCRRVAFETLNVCNIFLCFYYYHLLYYVVHTCMFRLGFSLSQSSFTREGYYYCFFSSLMNTHNIVSHRKCLHLHHQHIDLWFFPTTTHHIFPKQEYGSKVAYQIRFETSKAADTRILFMTEGLLLRQYASDPLLSNYSILIVDEVR